MRYTLPLLALIPLTALADVPPPPPAPAPVSYTLTPARSDVYVIIRNDTEATLARLGHDHALEASTFTGSVTWPLGGTGSCAVDIHVPVKSLVVDPPGLRDKAGLDDRVADEADKPKILANAWGASQLDAAKYSEVRFQSTSCSGTSGSVKVDGNLTIHGVTKPVSVTMNVSASATSFTAKGKVETSHTAFGFKPFAASMLGPRNQDRLTLVIDVTGAPK